MYVITEQKRADQWLARVRLETGTGWRCFAAAGDSRVGALMELHYAMWRYQGEAYDSARRAVVTAVVHSPHAARERRIKAWGRMRRRSAGAGQPAFHGCTRRFKRRTAWA